MSRPSVVPQKPTFDEMVHILKLIVDRKAHKYTDLVQLGVNPCHLEFMDSCYLFSTIGGPITGECFIHEIIKSHYDYYMTAEDAKQEWDTRTTIVEAELQKNQDRV